MVYAKSWLNAIIGDVLVVDDSMSPNVATDDLQQDIACRSSVCGPDNLDSFGPALWLFVVQTNAPCKTDPSGQENGN